MRVNWRTIAERASAIALLTLIVAALYYLTVTFLSLEKEVKVALIAGVFAFGVALATHYIQRKRELDFKVREKKIEAYQVFFDFLRFFLKSTKTGDLGSSDELVTWFHNVNYALVVWGSEPILRAWQEFYRWLVSHDAQKMDQPTLALNALLMRNKMAEVIALIRRDLGHNDKNLDVQTISDLYMPINFTKEDIAAVDEALKKSLSTP